MGNIVVMKPNSRLIGGVLEKRDLYIPLNVRCCAIQYRSSECVRIVGDCEPLVDPPAQTLFYEDGTTIDGLRAFVIESEYFKKR